MNKDIRHYKDDYVQTATPRRAGMVIADFALIEKWPNF